MKKTKTSSLLAKIGNFGEILEQLKGGKALHILVLCCCILRSRSCNLNKCKTEHKSVTSEDVKATTVYGRFKRIFQTGRGNDVRKVVFIIILHIVHRFMSPVLVVDRTEFTIGKRWVNVLCYGIICFGVFVPLIWKDLGKRKSSSQKERLELLDQLLAWWKATGIAFPPLSLLGDREFIGQNWIMALEKRGLKFVMRLRNNLRFTVWIKGQLREKKVKVKHLGRFLNKKNKQFGEIVILDSFITTFVVLPNHDPNAKEPFVYLITNLDNPLEAAGMYRKRWKIECCFKHLKSNGFNLEATSLEGAHKQDILFAIISLAYVLAIREGILNNYEEEVPLRTFSNGKIYRQKSLFLFGFEILKPKVDQLNSFLAFFKNVIFDILRYFKYPDFYY